MSCCYGLKPIGGAGEMVLDGLTQTEISGARAVVAQTDGDSMVTLRFRVGQADESLSTRGFTHLAEHLALAPFLDVRYPFQGITGPTVTTFAAIASGETQATFINGVADRLSAIVSGEVPTEEILHEAKILSAEQDQRYSGAIGSTASRLFGAQGLGLLAWDELGLRDLHVDQFRNWVDARFSRSNCIIALHNSDGAAISLGSLSVGELAAPVVPTPMVRPLPGYFRQPGPITFAAAVGRQNGALALAGILTKELFATLRQELGASYAPQIDYLRMSGDHAIFLGTADIKSEHASAGAQAFVKAINRLASDGPSQGEVDHQRETWLEGNKRIGAETGFLETSAEEILLGSDALSRTEIEAQWADLDIDRVQQIAVQVKSGYIMSIPGSAELDESACPELPEWSQDAPVSGQRYQYNRQRGPRDPLLGTPTIFLGEDGITLTNGAARTTTILKEDAQLMLHSADGIHSFVGTKGEGILIVPSRWDGPNHLIRSFRSWLEPHQIKKIGFRGGSPDSWDLPHRYGWRRIAARVAAVASVLIAALFFIAPTGLAVADRVLAWPFAITAFWGFWWLSNMVDTDPVDQMVHVLDNAGWHAHDPRFGTNRPARHAYVRGGLLLSWLMKVGLLDPWVVSAASEPFQRYRSGDLPAQDLYKELDGLIATDMVMRKARRFLVWMHAPTDVKGASRMMVLHDELAAGLANPFDLEITAETELAFHEGMRKQLMRGFALLDFEEFKDLRRSSS